MTGIVKRYTVNQLTAAFVAGVALGALVAMLGSLCARG